MEWLGLRFGELSNGSTLLLECSHNGFLVLLAFLIACACSFATLDMADRLRHTEVPKARQRWRWMGAGCLAVGVWAMHFISMLAFEAPVDIHYDLTITVASLVIALAAGCLAVDCMGRPTISWLRFLCSGVGMGLAIALMHYVGMSAIRSHATMYYDPALFGLSIGVSIAASLATLGITRHFRNGSGAMQHVLKLSTSLLMGAGIVSTHFTAMNAMNMAMPPGHMFNPVTAENGLQLALTIAAVTLMILAGSVSAAIADKKLQGKEHDLQRVNALLSQLDQARASLQHAAHYDALTNLINRRGFNQIFADKLLEQQASGGKLAIMFLDIDHFKRINDSLGHAAGDELLTVIASHITHAVRHPEDVVARFGGDEFCVLLALEHNQDAEHLARRIMQRMTAPISIAGRRMVMTTSIGISIYPDDGTTSEELLKNADLALYQSKDSGRNSIHFFSPSLRTRATLELQLEEELRHALREGSGLELFYQPIFDLRSGIVAKLEALIRWQHPQHGWLAPDRFLGVAEANGLIAELDSWVLRRACRDLGRLNLAGDHSLKMAVNCSALTLGRDALPGEIADALAKAGLKPERLELEVTENALMSNIASTAGLLNQIRELGVSLSIDDFGTGYSSLAYLKRLPLDTLKIDRSFIQDIPASPQDMEIVQAIIIMAHSLRLQVVTEGVETLAQYEFLESHGCDYLQGYLLSRPVPLSELGPVLDRLRQRNDPAVGRVK